MANNGETYVGFCFEPIVGKTFSSVSGGGGASWTFLRDVSNTGAHVLTFYDNAGAGHLASDLPVLDVNFTTAPASDGGISMVAFGNNSGTLARNTADMSNSGNGDNPPISKSYFGPQIGEVIIWALAIDNGGVKTSDPPGFVLLDTGIIGAGGSAIHWYVWGRWPSTGDGTGGFQDDRTAMNITSSGTNIHWALDGFTFANPTVAPYLLDSGVATLSGTHLARTAVQHGSGPAPPSLFGPRRQSARRS